MMQHNTTGPQASQADGTEAQLQILAKSHPEILTDPTIKAAMGDPAKLQQALQAWQHGHGMDPNNVYDDSGTLQNRSWFDDNLPWITALMGGAIGGAGLLSAGAGGGGAAAAGAAGGADTAAAAPLASTAIGSGMVPAIEGGTGLAGAAGAAGAAAPLASTTIGSGMMGPISGGTGMAGATGGSSLLDTLLGKSRGLSQVLGGAAKSAQSQNNFDSQNNLNWEKLKLSAPGIKAKTALGAALAKNYTPETINWGGPGSGLRGQIPTYSGGTSGAMAKSLQDPVLQQMLADAEAGKTPDYSKEQSTSGGLMDKLLGGGATASSLLSLFAH